MYVTTNWGACYHIADGEGSTLCRPGRTARITGTFDQPADIVCRMCLIEAERIRCGRPKLPRVKAPDKTIHCLGCSKTLVVSGSAHNKKFCDSKCRNDYNRFVRYPHLYEWKPVEPDERTCERCGDTFIGRRHAKYCSRLCQSRASDNRRKLRLFQNIIDGLK